MYWYIVCSALQYGWLLSQSKGDRPMNYPVEQGMTPRIGAQFFINPEDTPEDCRKHFALMRRYGIRLLLLKRQVVRAVFPFWGCNAASGWNLLCQFDRKLRILSFSLPVFKEQIVSFAQKHTEPLFQIRTDAEPCYIERCKAVRCLFWFSKTGQLKMLDAALQPHTVTFLPFNA